jgi:hypothetical protein
MRGSRLSLWVADNFHLYIGAYLGELKEPIIYVRRSMDVEDEILAEIEARDTALMQKNQLIQQKDQQLEQKDQLIRSHDTDDGARRLE